jgi:hypothetical protein
MNPAAAFGMMHIKPGFKINTRIIYQRLGSNLIMGDSRALGCCTIFPNFAAHVHPSLKYLLQHVQSMRTATRIATVELYWYAGGMHGHSRKDASH